MLEALHVGLCALTDSTGNSIFSWHFLKSNSVAHHNAEKSCYANQFCVAITNKQLNYFLLLHVCIMYMYYVCIHALLGSAPGLLGLGVLFNCHA